jgi:cellobiose-specific phosphotransferase system component IIB
MIDKKEKDLIDLVRKVRAHAEANYEKGWDIVVEAYTNGEIAEAIAGAKTKLGAIRKLSPVVKYHEDRRKEAEAYRDPYIYERDFDSF